MTDNGYDVLSRGMPYTVDEVETVMMQKALSRLPIIVELL